MTSFRRSLMFLSAGLLMSVAACHQAKPATPVSASAYEAQQTGGSADQDRASRDLPGYAPAAKPARVQPAAWPAPAPEPTAESSDDPMRQFDMP